MAASRPRAARSHRKCLAAVRVATTLPRQYRDLEGGPSMHSHRMFEIFLSTTRCLLAGASVLVAALFAGPSFADDDARPVKVMIINMFGGTPFPFSEASAFTANLRLTESIPVRGLSPDYPNLLCNSDDLCQTGAGEGHANVAASTTALILSNKFHLRHTDFLLAGLA